jgi:vitamin B12/bleomycin/antimicrobial peptide transport system ATP-binding/permease protein
VSASIINAYVDIANWQAVTQRLSGFEEPLQDAQESASAKRRIAFQRKDSGTMVKNLSLDLPDGRSLLCGINFNVDAGGSLLIRGPAGAGKSVLLRAIAGIWPFGSGQVKIGPGSSLFVPQLPSSPLGTLKSALLYPLCDEGRVPPERLKAVLESVGLGALIAELESENWSHLSQAEQQQLAFARILLAEPEFLFLDDATSALDDEAEAKLYGMLGSPTWRPTVISASNKTRSLHFHSQVLDISTFYGSQNGHRYPKLLADQKTELNPGH